MTPEFRKVFILGLIFTFGIGFAGGIWFNTNQPPLFRAVMPGIFGTKHEKPDDLDFSLFWEVYGTLKEKYVDKGDIDIKKITYGAISGMVNSVGDPYTVFLEPVINEKFQEEIKGEFGGVGMEIGKRNGVLTVISPIKDSPAIRAGVKAGDRIVKIDGKSTAEMSVEEAVGLIRGIKGTKVSITLTPATNGTQRTVELIRDTIKIPTVELKFFNNGKVAYIALYSFNQTAEGEFEKAMKEVIASGATRLVLDLRNNPGGLLDASVELAGWFLPPRTLVTTEAFGDGSKNEFRTSGNGTAVNMHVVILINGGSASASEILAGALHDNKGTKLIGEKTFGKGSVQQVEEFDDGSSLKVTVAKWLTPSGISISEKGIEADVEVKFDEKAIQDGLVEIGVPGKDAQLDKAIEIILGL